MPLLYSATGTMVLVGLDDSVPTPVPQTNPFRTPLMPG